MSLPIHDLLVVGALAELAPERFRAAAPKPGTNRRGGRLPLLAARCAAALCERTLGAAAQPRAAVLFGTALGALTETELFVANLIRSREEEPKPRAFSSSVHNAIASRAALELGARGECQTFVQDGVAFVHALGAALRVAARDPGAPIVCGGLDEPPPGAFGTIAGGGGHDGGAVLLGGAVPTDGLPLCDLAAARTARPRDERAWLAGLGLPASIRRVEAGDDAPGHIALAVIELADREPGARAAVLVQGGHGDRGVVVLERR